jgi:hypothetical protein
LLGNNTPRGTRESFGIMVNRPQRDPKKVAAEEREQRWAEAEDMSPFGAERKCQHGSLPAVVRGIPEIKCWLRGLPILTLSRP